MSSFCCEAAVVRGEDAATLFVDIQKFYDHIDLSRLIDKMVELDYPEYLLLISCQVMAGPRVLSDSSTYSEWIYPDNSIVAGSGQANNFARGMLFAILKKTAELLPRGLNQFVDDVSLRVTGNPWTIRRTLRAAAKQFIGDVQDLGFTVSPKSVLVATTSDLSAQLALGIVMDTGVEFTVEAATRELGADAAAGKRRSTLVQNKRLAAGRLRTAKIGVVAAPTGRGAYLFNSGSFPQSCYAHLIMGFAPFQDAEDEI